MSVPPPKPFKKHLSNLQKTLPPFDAIVHVENTENCEIKIFKWKVKENYSVTTNQIVLLYKLINSADKEIKRLKSTHCGVVAKRLFKEGDIVERGNALLQLSACIHTTVIKDMCADCGADLRRNGNGNTSEASVPMIHSVPELKVTQKLAQKLGQEDTERLLNDKKLVLLVDLDQTLIHTTNDNVPNNLKDVYHFQLYGPSSPWYHTRLRPGTPQFLTKMAPYYELHICTFGARNYAHMIANFLDEDGKFFSHRILSRDECFNIQSKTDNLKALFPCGDAMVCIIDDREDVWNMASNLIQVRPYHFFQHTGDINAPPGMSKHDLDGKGVDFKNLNSNTAKAPASASPSASQSLSAPQSVSASPVASLLKNDEKIDTENDKEEDKTATNQLPSATSIDDVKEEKSITDSNNEIMTKTEATKEDIPEENVVVSENSQKTNEPTVVLKENADDDECVDSIAEPFDEWKYSKLLCDENTNRSLNSDSDDNLIEVEDPDDYLLYLEHILIEIHKRFYEKYEEMKKIPDLKHLIPKIRSEVLLNKNLVFSGIVPNQLKLEQSKAYQIARSLGANVRQHLSETTTHLVAVASGTIKVNAAKNRSDIIIVTPDWLWTCAERWECVDERLYPLDPNKPSKMRQPPSHCLSPEHVVNYNETTETADGDLEPKFIDTINPLLSFSNADLADMNQDFDQFFESDTSSDEEPRDIENPPIEKSLRKRKREQEKEDAQIKFFAKTEEQKVDIIADDENSQSKQNEEDAESSEDDSPSTKFRRGGNLPSDLDLGSDCGSDEEDEGEEGDWNLMGAALEREFLGLK